MADEIQFLNDLFNLHYANAQKAKNAGNNQLAKVYYFQASEDLLKLAKMSSGNLKKARLDRAKRLLAIASNLPGDGESGGAQQEGATSGKKSEKQNAQGDESETRWESAKIPNLSFDDVAGLYEVKRSVNERVILPLKYPEVYAQFKKKAGGGILLYGPPGTGKTMIAKAIAHEIGANFFSVKCSDIVSKWFGEAEKNIKSLFKTARSMAGKDSCSVIFFDEFESIACKRGGDQTVMNRIVPELLAQMQGFEEGDEKLLLLAATNRPWDIDSAMLRPGRFNEMIHITLPDYDARLFIINKNMHGIPLDADVDFAEIAQFCDGFNGADIVEFCERLKNDAIARTIKNGSTSNITRQDAVKISESVKSSVVAEDIDNFRKFEESRGK